MRYGIVVSGYIGDCLFASSIAKKLKQEGQASEVHYFTYVPQPLKLLQANPFIDSAQIVVAHIPIPCDKFIHISQVDQARPATIQMQEAAGVREPSVEYDVYTSPEYDTWARESVVGLKQQYGRPVVAWQSNWRERAYQTTPEQNARHEGGPHRDIPRIIAELNKRFIMLEVGLPDGVNQFAVQAQDAELYAKTASVIKFCDWMIGAEGGLTNLAAGVGTKCIITTCFIHQVYGKNGFVRQIEDPQMGPQVYFPSAGHVHLPPFIPDQQVLDDIVRHILSEHIPC